MACGASAADLPLTDGCKASLAEIRRFMLPFSAASIASFLCTIGVTRAGILPL